MESSDKYRNWGVFYINPNDPALFVEKRYGIGYTLNFGNRWSWAMIALILLAIVLPFSVPIYIIHELRRRFVRFGS